MQWCSSQSSKSFIFYEAAQRSQPKNCPDSWFYFVWNYSPSQLCKLPGEGGNFHLYTKPIYNAFLLVFHTLSYFLPHSTRHVGDLECMDVSDYFLNTMEIKQLSKCS